MNDQQNLSFIADCFEFMPGSTGKHNQSELPELFLKHKIENAVTFFGGTFNPFHEGHRACLDLCPENNILIVPDHNPFKEVGDLEKELKHFLALASELEQTNFSLYPGFLLTNEKNPTSSWLPHVKIKEKNFLMGDDSYMDLLKWKSPELIAKSLTKLYVVPRQFTEKEYVLIERELLKWNPKLEVHYLAAHPYMNISSTNIRSNRK